VRAAQARRILPSGQILGVRTISFAYGLRRALAGAFRSSLRAGDGAAQIV
jgi:hypothetical protein